MVVCPLSPISSETLYTTVIVLVPFQNLKIRPFTEYNTDFRNMTWENGGLTTF